MAISYVGAGTDFAQASSGTGFTINRPAGVTTGDLMIAVVSLDTYSTTSSSVTITNPTGWTTVSTVTPLSYCRFRVMTRVHSGTEPTSWTGSLSTACPHRVAVSVAYRGASTLTPVNSAVVGSGTSVGTGSVTNSAATGWRLSVGSYVSTTVSSAISASGQTERANATAEGGGVPGGVEVSFGDSNAAVATGSHSRTYTRGASWESAGGWIGILNATAGADVTGTMEVNPLPLPQMSADGALSYTGTLAATLPKPTVDMAGIASPPEGILTALILPTVQMTGQHDSAGPLEVMLVPTVSINGETRFFGVRVITPEAESRTVTPRLGATD